MEQSDLQDMLRGSFLSCLHYVLESEPRELPRLDPDEDPARGWTVSRWLGGLGMGIAPVADPGAFSWAGNWIARVHAPGCGPRYAVMFGVPSGVVWDPAADGVIRSEWITEGYLLAATDIAQARPALPTAPTDTGVVEAIWIAAGAGELAQSRSRVRARPGRGLEGDRHVAGTGTFPSGRPGSALTLIAAEVCESFEPPLVPDEHRRNLVVRGLDLNRLVGHDFQIGSVRCRGMRLCEPCRVMERYAGRPVLRALVHRGGLRADILRDGEIGVGDTVHAVGDGGLC